MSQRPRYGDDGRLLVPDEVMFHAERGSFLARHAGRDADPFDWTADHLLLAESFARLDLGDPDISARWFAGHGMIDRYRLHRLKLGQPPVPLVPREGWDVVDPIGLVMTIQESVRWFLTTLERLSLHRDDHAWDPLWGRVVLEGAMAGLIIGVGYSGAHVPPEPSDKDRAEWPAEMVASVEADRAAFADWPRALVGEGVNDVAIGADDDREPVLVFEFKKRATTLGTTWRDTVILLRLILEARLGVTAEPRFAIGFEMQDDGTGGREVIVPREMRVWTSIIDPIYLQIFEALRRITEGIPGATTCRECGQPFLVLDARRRFFCNERERTRFAHRERRRRLMAGEHGGDTTADPEQGAP